MLKMLKFVLHVIYHVKKTEGGSKRINGYRISVWKDEDVLELDGVDG